MISWDGFACMLLAWLAFDFEVGVLDSRKLLQQSSWSVGLAGLLDFETRL